MEFLMFSMVRDVLERERLDRKWVADNFIKFYNPLFNNKQVRIYINNDKKSSFCIRESQDAVLLCDKANIPIAKMHTYGISGRYYELKRTQVIIYSLNFKCINPNEKRNYILHFCPLYPELSYLSLIYKTRKTKWCIPYNVKSESYFDFKYKTFMSVV